MSSLCSLSAGHKEDKRKRACDSDAERDKGERETIAGVRTYMKDKRDEGDTQGPPNGSKHASQSNNGGDPLGHQLDARVIGGGKCHPRAYSGNKQEEREHLYNAQSETQYPP